MSMIILRSARERFLLKSRLHCATPTVKWVQRQISYNDEGGKIIVNLHVSAFCFYCFGCVFCRAVKAWKILPNKQMLFFNPLALGKECLEILTFSVKGIKTKQNKKNPSSQLSKSGKRSGEHKSCENEASQTKIKKRIGTRKHQVSHL